MAKDDRIYIRINSELKQAAQQHAQETGRSLAGLIEYLLRQELKKGEKEMNTWIVLDYKNGNKSIMSKTQYEKEVGSLNDYDEAVAGIVESEKQPTWLDLEFDGETKQYYLAEKREKRESPRRNVVDEMKTYIQDQIQEHGFENDQIEIDFAGICEESETIQAAKELGYLATPGDGQGVWWIYSEK